MLDGEFVGVRKRARARRVDGGGDLRRDGARDLDARHLAADDEDLATAVPHAVGEQALQVAVLAAVDHGNDPVRVECNVRRDDGLAEEARRDKQVVERGRLLLTAAAAGLGLDSDGPGAVALQ
ncbi:hypothetical protein CH063_10602, partial [Colletotrichum higginsianum]